MADVFVSYDHDDAKRVARIVDRLKDHWLDVWWDIKLRNGQQYSEIIENQLIATPCVLAAWSKHSRNSVWVKAESSLGFDNGKLIQMRLDPVTPPLPFNVLLYADFSAKAESEDAEWAKLIQSIEEKRGGAHKRPERPRGALAAPGAVNGGVLMSLGALAAFGGVGAGVWSGQATQLAIQAPLAGAAALGGAAALMTVQRMAALARAGG